MPSNPQFNLPEGSCGGRSGGHTPATPFNPRVKPFKNARRVFGGSSPVPTLGALVGPFSEDF